MGDFTLPPFAISQSLAALAIVADAASFQFRSCQSILVFFVLSTTFLSIHYFLLGDTSAGILFGLAAVRNLVAYFYSSQTTLSAFLVLSALGVYLTYSGPADFVALMASLCATIAAFQKRDLGVRIWSLSGSCFWLIFNLWLASPLAVTHRFIFLVSNVVGLWRFYSKKIALDLAKDNT